MPFWGDLFPERLLPALQVLLVLMFLLLRLAALVRPHFVRKKGVVSGKRVVGSASADRLLPSAHRNNRSAEADPTRRSETLPPLARPTFMRGAAFPRPRTT